MSRRGAARPARPGGGRPARAGPHSDAASISIVETPRGGCAGRSRAASRSPSVIGAMEDRDDRLGDLAHRLLRAQGWCRSLRGAHRQDDGVAGRCPGSRLSSNAGMPKIRHHAPLVSWKLRRMPAQPLELLQHDRRRPPPSSAPARPGRRDEEGEHEQHQQRGSSRWRRPGPRRRPGGPRPAGPAHITIGDERPPSGPAAAEVGGANGWSPGRG